MSLSSINVVGARLLVRAGGQAGAGENAAGGQGSKKTWQAKADPNFIGYTYKNYEAVQPGDPCGWPSLGRSHARSRGLAHAGAAWCGLGRGLQAAGDTLMGSGVGVL